MGYTGFDSTNYQKAVGALKSTGRTFTRSQQAQASGNFRNLAEHLDPRKLKNGMRECCFAAGFADALPIVVSIDATGSMDQVPYDLQSGLPTLIDLLLEQGVSDRPNVLFLCHDDEQAVSPDAAFQISQFETASDALLGALNELIIPHNGGGNRGESYHLSAYAASRHLRLEAHERDGSKGFFFMICDEEPIIGDGDPTKRGTSPAIAKEIFGDSLEAEVSLLDSFKALGERFHVFVIRPGHTSHGTDKAITEKWRKLLAAAGIDREHVMEIQQTASIIPTMALTIGTLYGADRGSLIQVLKTKGAAGVADADAATQALVKVGTALAATGRASGELMPQGSARER